MEDIALNYTDSHIMDTWSFEAQVNEKNDTGESNLNSQAEANLLRASKSQENEDNAPIEPSDNKPKKHLRKFVKGIFNGKSRRKPGKKGGQKSMGKREENITKEAPATSSSTCVVSHDAMTKPASLKSIASKESHDVSMSSLSISTHGGKHKKKRKSKKDSSLDRKRLEKLVSELMAHPHGFIFVSDAMAGH
jgi:hypothetical protein